MERTFSTNIKRSQWQIQPDINQDITPTKAIPTKPPIKAEIIAAIQELNKGKAPGIDNITPELLKINPEMIAKIFEPLLKEIWEQEGFAR
jgi:hypothetical protein